MEYAYKKDWWETKDHEKIKISDMETSHIKNTIKYLQRHSDFYDEYFGDNWFGYDYEDNSHLVDKKIEELENELKRRNENMKKAPKVLTRMRLSCCWGYNLDEKELNDIVDYINELEHQGKKQKEVIDKVKEWEQYHTILVYTKKAPRKFVGTYELLQILEDKEV